MWQDYVSRPTEVCAIYWDGTDDVLHALEVAGCSFICVGEDLRIAAGVNGDQAEVPVRLGTYILYDDYPSRHFWPCDKAVFERKYESRIG